MKINQIKDLIGKGNIEEAIGTLIKDVPTDSLFHNELIQLGAKLSILKKENRIGTVEYQNGKIEMNKISYGVLEIIKAIENEKLEKNNQKRLKTYIYWIIPCLLFIALFLYWATNNKSTSSNIPEPKRARVVIFNTKDVKDCVTLMYSSKHLNRLDTFTVSYNENIGTLKEAIKRYFNIKIATGDVQGYDEVVEYLVGNQKKLPENLTIKEAGVKNYDIIEYTAEYTFRRVDGRPQTDLFVYIKNVNDVKPVLIIDNSEKGELISCVNKYAKFKFRIDNFGEKKFSFRLIDGNNIYEFGRKAEEPINQQYDEIHIIMEELK